MVEMEHLNQMSLAMLAIMVLIFVCAYALKKFKQHTPFGNKKLALLASLPVGSKEKIMLVEVEGQKILVGSTSQYIQTLWIVDSQSTAPIEPTFNAALDKFTDTRSSNESA